ncbi:MAG: TetR/AcrR family transcriptional regulator [Salinivirgaceae bacterium]|nr:TetR/AcrR family transcriptional regulator [Salinivirgaceae bacterium]
METRGKILEGAGELFFRNGCKAVTMDLLAQHLGISKRTIYQNFTDKEELIRVFLEDKMLLHDAKFHSMIDDCSNIYEAFIKHNQHQREFVEKISPSFFSDLRKYYGNILHDVFNNRRKVNLSNIGFVLKKGIESGIFKNNINTNICSEMVMQMVDLTIKLSKEGQYNDAEIYNNLMIPYLMGISTEKGIIMLTSIIHRHTKF